VKDVERLFAARPEASPSACFGVIVRLRSGNGLRPGRRGWTLL